MAAGINVRSGAGEGKGTFLTFLKRGARGADVNISCRIVATAQLTQSIRPCQMSITTKVERTV